MKIFNKDKTHFMQKNEKGVYNLEFDTIENVQAKINSILDASNHPTENPLFEISENLKTKLEN